MTFSPYMPAAGAGQSAIREWAQLTSEILANLERNYDAIARPLRLWGSAGNGLPELVAATAPDELVGDSDLTALQVNARNVVFGSLLQWLSHPHQIGVDAEGQPIIITPLELLSQR